jgi:hypothetical protein
MMTMIVNDELGRKRRWPVSRCHFSICLEGQNKAQKNSVSVDCLRAQNRTRDFPNIKQEL